MGSEAAWGGFLVIVIICLSIAGASAIIKFSEGRHECNENKNCQITSYCGSDFKCHEFPTRLESTNNWVLPALIVGACVIIGAVIIRNKPNTT
ncbi:MAG TPA: hypothetical protein VJJ82_03090 [Candidatus Nanoarchaeia archaeon]|nr:hypothetical protein [Candidatus Nanoarchaeia archaeon]